MLPCRFAPLLHPPRVSFPLLSPQLHWYFFFICQMITQVLHCAGRFIKQHTAPNIPHLPASTRSSLSLCLSPEPWSEPSVCTLRLVCVCEHMCVCMHVRWYCARGHLTLHLLLSYRLMGIILPLQNHDDSTFADACSEALNMFVLSTQLS